MCCVARRLVNVSVIYRQVLVSRESDSTLTLDAEARANTQNCYLSKGYSGAPRI